VARISTLQPGERVGLTCYACEGYEVKAEGARVALCTDVGMPDQPIPPDVRELMPMSTSQDHLTYIAKDRKQYTIQRV
jgi:hypothetical protein